MIIKTNWTIPCAGCGKIHTVEQEQYPLEVGPASLPLPKEWATAVVLIQEPVIPASSERMYDMLSEAGVSPEYINAMAESLRESSPPFQATFVVCPDCQTGGLWSAVKAEMMRATEKSVQRMSSQMAKQGNVLQFPFGSGMPDGLYATPHDGAVENEDEH